MYISIVAFSVQDSEMMSYSVYAQAVSGSRQNCLGLNIKYGVSFLHKRTENERIKKVKADSKIPAVI